MVILRALIDQESQITTLSEGASKILSLPRTKNKTEIHGHGGAVVGVSQAKIKLALRPRFLSDKSVEIEALILSHLTGAQPDQSFKVNIGEFNNFILVYPAFKKSNRIHVVIGADVIPRIMEECLIKKVACWRNRQCFVGFYQVL